MTRCAVDCPTPTPAQAHCTVCHRTFSRASAFDRHRRDGGCLDPVELGMTVRDGVWRWASTGRAHWQERRAVS